MNWKANLKLNRPSLRLGVVAAFFAATGGAAHLLDVTDRTATLRASCAPLDPAAQGWRLSFEDDFDRLDAFDGRRSRWETQFLWGQRTIAANGERQIYVDPGFAGSADAPLGLNPFTLDGGVLAITAREADAALRAKLGSEEARYTSGLLTTARSFLQTYGYFEIRARMPAGRGLWPAFWLLPPGGRWPPEIDIVEVFGQEPDKLYVSAHTAEDGRHKGITKAVRVADTSRGFHTYGVLWTAERLTWFFDGCRVADLPTPADLHGPMYMLVNLAVGGTWATYPDRTTRFPAAFEIDRVRAYALP
jgi:beta-glucanase (GH16 family)